MAEPVKSSIEVEVRYAETDQMGVVHHANYLIWFELARTHLCQLSGYAYSEIEKNGHLLMVTGAEASYRRGAKYGDKVRVTCSVARLASRGIRFAYEVHRSDEILARGATEHIWIDAANGRPCRTPEVLRAPFARLAGVDG